MSSLYCFQDLRTRNIQCCAYWWIGAWQWFASNAVRIEMSLVSLLHGDVQTHGPIACCVVVGPLSVCVAGRQAEVAGRVDVGARKDKD